MNPAFVFAYGSLVSAASAAETLGRDEVDPRPAMLAGWLRSFSLVRDNRRCEKTFARLDGTIPSLVLALGVEPDPTGRSRVNGALIEVSDADLDRLDRRELRYDRIVVSGEVSEDATGRRLGDVFTYVAKPAHRAHTAPEDAVVLAGYERTVEAAFSELGPGQLEEFHRTTKSCAAERIEAILVTGEIPPGNPRGW